MRASTRALLLSLTCGLAFGAFNAQAEEISPTKAIDYRESIMTLFKWNLSPLGDMASGEISYDAERFEKHARDLIAASRLDLLSGFPEGSDTGATGALAEIWFEWDDFAARYDDLRKATDALEEAVNSGDETAMKKAVGGVGKSCKGCHDKFKE